MWKRPVDSLFRPVALMAVICACVLAAGCSGSQDSPTTPGETSVTCPAVVHTSGATIGFPLSSAFDQMRSATIDMCLNGACGQVVFNLSAPPTPGGGLGKDGPRVTSSSGEVEIRATLWSTLAGDLELEAQWQSPVFETFHDGDVYSLKGTAGDGTALFDLTQIADHYTQNSDPEYPCLGRWQTFSITRAP